MVGVPADRISTSEHGKRTQGLEAPSHRGQARFRAVAPPANRRLQTAFDPRQSSTNGGQPPPKITGFEPEPQVPERTLAPCDSAGHRCVELMGKLVNVAAS